MRVVVPSTPYDAKGLLTRALRCDDPVLFLEHRELLATKGNVPEEDYEIEFGQARVLREGSDVTVVAIAHMVQKSLAAAEQLAAAGISVELIDPRTISPLDTDTILPSVHKTGRLLIVDETFARTASARRSRRTSPTPASTISTHRSSGSTARFRRPRTVRPWNRQSCRAWKMSSTPIRRAA